MRWYFRLLEQGATFYLYAYSRESKDFDGRIRYDTETETISVTIPCAADRDSEWLQEKARNHFWKVIRDGFPQERSVCCG